MRRLITLLLLIAGSQIFSGIPVSAQDGRQAAQDSVQKVVEEKYTEALSLARRGQFAEAREIFDKIIPDADAQMQIRICGYYFTTWYMEGVHYYSNLNFPKAMECFQMARDGYHRMGYTKSEIDVLYYIAELWNFLDNFEQANKLFQQAYNLARPIQYDDKMMSILLEQYELYDKLGDDEQIQRTFARIDSLAKATTDDEIRFDYHNFLGDLAKSHKNYKLALQCYSQNDEYIQNLPQNYSGANKHSYYLKLRDLYIQTKNYDKALEYAIKCNNEVLRYSKSGNRGSNLTDLVIYDIYSRMGDSLKCFSGLDSLIRQAQEGSEPKLMEILYTTRARCYAKFGNYSQALADYKQADAVLAAKYDEDDKDRVTLLALMGGVESKLGLYPESEQHYRQYCERMKQLVGENHLDYINAIGYYANAEAFAGHIEAACRDYTTAVDKLRQQVHQRLPYLTTGERESYWKSVSELILRMTPFALEAKNTQTAFTRTCYDGLVLSKAFLLQSEQSAYDLIKKNGDAQDLLDYSHIAGMRTKITDLERQGRVYADSLMALRTKVHLMETHLAEKCRAYGDMTKFMNIGYDDIKAHLKDGDILIDFTDFVSKSSGRVYAAYIIQAKQENPLLMRLFNESEIDSMQVAYPERYYDRDNAEQMLHLLWNPLKDKVAEGSTVFYVPSQFLFQIALESLPTEDGSLLGEHYNFVRLSSARELLDFNPNISFDLAGNEKGEDSKEKGLNGNKKCENKDAILYGGLQYNMGQDDMVKEADKYVSYSLIAMRGGVTRGSTTQGDSVFRYLAWSKKEVDDIANILLSHKIGVDTLTGTHGTEESFLSLNGHSPTILHMATHGFFYTPEKARDIDYLRGYEDAMSLSGLIMAGANTAWRGNPLPNNVLDGILKASTIAQLDLSHTKLAVLSACKSGNGKATPEGLYGLQRAFKKAGAKTMIMSLWGIDDKVSTEFMETFYTALVKKGNKWDKHKAFEKAKAKIRKKYKAPYYWAAFVMLD